MGNKKYRKAGGSSSKPSAAEKSRGRAPELKGVEFTYGKNSDAAGYDKVRFNLVRHVAVQNWPGADKASIALETGLKPMLVEPTAPTIPQLKYLAKVKKTQPDGSEVEVEELVDYTEMELWVEKEKYYRANKKYESDEKSTVPTRRTGRRTNLACSILSCSIAPTNWRLSCRPRISGPT